MPQTHSTFSSADSIRPHSSADLGEVTADGRLKMRCLYVIEGPFTRQKRRNGSGRNEHRFQQNLTVYTCKFCKGTDKRMARSSEIRGTDKDRLQIEQIEPAI